MPAVIHLKMFELPDDFRWLAPWSPIGDESVALQWGQIQSELESGQAIADRLVGEFQREMPDRHVLKNCQLFSRKPDVTRKPKPVHSSKKEDDTKYSLLTSIATWLAQKLEFENASQPSTKFLNPRGNRERRTSLRWHSPVQASLNARRRLSRTFATFSSEEFWP